MSDNHIGLKKIVAANEHYAIGYAELNHKHLTFVKYGRGWESTPIPDARGQTCLICRRPWVNDVEDLRNTINLAEGNKEPRLVHETCHIGHLIMNEYNLFARSLIAAELWTTSIVAIPNEYKGAWNTDWFVATLKDYHPIQIKFGRRKRVWEIEAKGIEFSVPKDFLKSEDVTKEFSAKYLLIHAWDEAKIVEYLKAFKTLFVAAKIPNMYNIPE